MSIVDGVGLIEWEGGLFTPDSQLLPRVKWAFTQIRAEGGSITLNEAGRPFGVSSDQYARNSADTLSGLSTVWYQWGRYRRGETPSAANPAGGAYASEHTQGIAIDCNASPMSLRAKYFSMVGLSNTIASESWHWAIRGPSQVDLAGYGWAGGNSTPFDNRTPEQIEEDELMGAKEDIVNSNKYYVDAAVANAVNQITAVLQASVERLLDAERRESRPRLYQINEPGNDRHSLAAAIDIDEGYVRLFGSPEELKKAKDQQDVAPEAPFPLSAADFDAKVAAARANTKP